jgi:2,3-diketo-5-methylthio-1-phosphopentane phosphatase
VFDLMQTRAIFVSDFDGTFTRQDFYRLILEENLVPPDTPNFWLEYVQGRMSHFEALQATFDAARIGEPELERLVGRMEPDPAVRTELFALRERGWEVVIASAGCLWYIERILRALDIDVEVHANPGRVQDGRLRMEPALHSPFHGLDAGIDKAAIIRHARTRAPFVAYAGDGLSDIPPSLLVNPRARFARGMLADALHAQELPCRLFERWSEITRALRILDFNADLSFSPDPP